MFSRCCCCCCCGEESGRTTANSKQRDARVALVGVCGVRVCVICGRNHAELLVIKRALCESRASAANSRLLNLSTRTTLEEAARLCDATHLSMYGMIVTVFVFL